MSRSDSGLNLWRWGLGIGAILSLLALTDLVRLLLHIGISLFASNWTLILVTMTLSLVAILGLFAATWLPAGQTRLASLSRPKVPAPLGRWAAGAGFILISLAYTWLTMASPIRLQLLTNPNLPYYITGWENNNYVFIDALSGLRVIGSVGASAPNPWLHLWLFGMFAALAAGVLTLAGVPFWRGLALAALAQTLAYRLALYIPEVTAFPFSLGWSEASRYYYASLMVSPQVYGERFALPIFHMSRYMLQAIPFLFGSRSLEFHRFWQVFLWLALTGASSLVLARRLRIADRWTVVIFALWAYFFYMQGAVYYHLQVMVILALAGFSAEKPARTFIFVLLASLWAGLSRVNWYPVPAMIAGLLYFLEKPVSGTNWFKYLLWPATWGVAGVATAAASQAIYIKFSGYEDISGFGSTFTSDLLWYRLMPSASFPMGVIPSVTLVALPGLLALFWLLRGQAGKLHPLRWLGIAGYIAVLFAGGLVVSTKIGGGGDLHNMDAFLTVFLVLVAYALFGQIRPESGEWTRNPLPWPVLALGLLVPLAFVLSRSFTLEPTSPDAGLTELREIRVAVNQARKNGEALFITQRQLLTFRYMKIPLVPEYELLTLMEMSISNNQLYLDQFHADLANHRFAVIVADKQVPVIKNELSAFSEENNAWVTNVSIPLLCDYEPVQSYDAINVQVFVPRAERACPQPILSTPGE